MIVKPCIDLNDGLTFISFIKKWNDLKLLILTDLNGVIDSMSKSLMDHMKISSDDEIEEAKYNLEWILPNSKTFYRDINESNKIE